MELILSEEQQLLKDSAAKFMEQRAGAPLARRVRDADAPLDREVWRQIAAAGWLAILVPEDAGGLGLGMTELALVLEEAGAALLPAPVAAASAAAKVLAEGDNANDREELLAAIIAGDTIVVPALQEEPLDLDPAGAACRAAEDGDGLRLTGSKSFIPAAGGADGFLVNAAGDMGMVLCYVPRDTEYIALAVADSIDGGDTGKLVMEGAPISAKHVVAGPNRAPEAVAALYDLTVLGLGAELLGVMGRALDLSIDYLKLRTQFDRPIGSFQALQHRAVNDYVDVELTRSLLFQAAAAADRGEEVSAMASALKAKASGAALAVTRSAIQFHGAIGYSDEHDIGLYFKRAIALSTHYGNETAHRRRFARLAGI